MTSKSRSENDIALAATDPYSGSNLVPMLVSGLILIVVGMLAVAALINAL